MFDLKILKANETVLVLSTPCNGRIIFFGIAFFLGLMMALDARLSFVPVMLVLIALLAGLYTEKWLFDLDRQLVVHTEGLLFLNKKKTFPFRSVVRIELRNSKSKTSTAVSQFEAETPSYSIAPSGPDAASDQELNQDLININRKKGFSGIFLVLSNGREENVHTTSIKKAQEQAALGQLISRKCRKPFSIHNRYSGLK